MFNISIRLLLAENALNFMAHLVYGDYLKLDIKKINRPCQCAAQIYFMRLGNRPENLSHNTTWSLTKTIITVTYTDRP